MEFIFKHNETIYKKNMKALKKCYPDVYERLKTAGQGDWKLTKTTFRGVFNAYSAQHNMLYYQENPLQDVKMQLGQLKLKNARLAVFLGMGLGYEVMSYIKYLLPQQNTVFLLIVEKDLSLFHIALRVTDLTALIQCQGITFLIGLPQEELYSFLRHYIQSQNKFYYLKTIKPIYHASSMVLYKEYYLEVLKQVTQAGKDVVTDFGNAPHDALMGIENMLNNLEHIIKNPGVNLLFNQFKDMPAVIAATGPSLDKNKHLLKGLADKALIICPDASLKILLNIGVKPHLVTSLERTPGTIRFVQGIPYEEVKNVYFAACPVVNKNTFDAYCGPKIIVYRQIAHFKLLNIERGTLEIRKSSGNMAFKVAEALGCNPIILIGQDLAYSRDGKTHAEGTLDKDGQARNTQTYYDPSQAIEVQGNDGKTILTHPMWYSFLKVYEYDLSRYQGVCINSTEGGAYIPGTTVMPLAEAIDKYIKKPLYPLQRIQTAIEKFFKQDSEAELVRVKNLLQGAVADLNAVLEACDAGEKIIFEKQKKLEVYCTMQQLTADQQKKLAHIKQQVDNYHKQVLQSSPGFKFILMPVIQSYLLSFEMDYYTTCEKYSIEHLALIENVLQRAQWFDTVKKLTQFCLNYLERSLQNITLKGEKCGQAEF
ncbi:MAG: 6-hydroxymethylpterin diphosphokinase MptE-like protein [Phycisphaerales bacterium]